MEKANVIKEKSRQEFLKEFLKSGTLCFLTDSGELQRVEKDDAGNLAQVLICDPSYPNRYMSSLDNRGTTSLATLANELK